MTAPVASQTTPPTPITELVLDRASRGKFRTFDEKEFLGSVFALEYAVRQPSTSWALHPQRIAKAMLGWQQSATFEPQSWDVCLRLIAELSGLLGRLVKHYRGARLELQAWATGVPLGIVFVPIWEPSGEGLQLRHAMIADEMSAVLRYAAALVVGETYSKQLCRCGLPECGQFFLAVTTPGGGRPRREYCTEEHMRIFHDRNAAERVARYRKRLAAGKRK